MVLVNVIKGYLGNGTVINNVMLPLNAPIEGKKPGFPYGMNYKGSFNSSNVKDFPYNRVNLRVFFKHSNDFSVMQSVEEIQETTVANETVATSYVPVEEDSRSDNDIIQEVTKKFNVIGILTNAISDGKNVRSIVVSGSPGTGKSYSVMSILKEKEKTNKALNFVVLKGSISAIKLYSQLWECKDKNSVVVLDDCDAVVEDMETLNMVKAATDTSTVRTICYNKLSSYLEEQGIPNSFDFEGGLIYLSNINFAQEVERKTKLAPHVDAFISRSLYINVSLTTKREKILRMITVIDSNEFKTIHDLTDDEAEVIKNWIIANQNVLIEISIRTAVKLANLVKDFPTEWETIAEITLKK